MVAIAGAGHIDGGMNTGRICGGVVGLQFPGNDRIPTPGSYGAFQKVVVLHYYRGGSGIIPNCLHKYA